MHTILDRKGSCTLTVEEVEAEEKIEVGENDEEVK